MKKELQELGLLNTKTLTKLVFYNESQAFQISKRGYAVTKQFVLFSKNRHLRN
jgi:hypothetical protein